MPHDTALLNTGGAGPKGGAALVGKLAPARSAPMAFKSNGGLEGSGQLAVITDGFTNRQAWVRSTGPIW